MTAPRPTGEAGGKVTAGASNEPGSRSNKAIDFFSAGAGDYVTKHYDAPTRTFMTVRREKVLEFIGQLHLAEGATVLDAGCGPGHLAVALASQGFAVSALDGAEPMLDAAKRNAADFTTRFPIAFQLGDIERLPYADATFDLVVSTGVIEYLPDDARVLAEFRRVLKPGGALVLPVTNASAPSLWLESTVEFLKRRRWFMQVFNAVWCRLGHTEIRPRHFVTRQHRVPNFLRALSDAGFIVNASGYFFLLPWPRPLDQLFPQVTSSLSERMERHAGGRLGALGEGFVALARRPASSDR